jgi:hypothetical protein
VFAKEDAMTEGELIMLESSKSIQRLTSRKRNCWHTRAFIGAALATAICFGASLAFLWAAADIFFKLSTGDGVQKAVITKFEAWNRIYKEKP